MVLYVAYRASKESKDISLLPHRLRALGCKQVHKSFWEVEDEKVSKALKVLEKNQPILLRRVREIRKPLFQKREGGSVSDLGSLIIVMYATPKEAKREQIKNFLRKAPCIRICRSVYVFSQNHALFDRNEELVDAFKFAEFIKGIQEDVKIIPRLVIVNTDSNERFLRETKERIEELISNIVKCCKELCDAALNEKHNAPRMKDVLSRNKRIFMTVKNVVAFYEKWLRMEFSKSLLKPYRALKKANSAVEMMEDKKWL